MRTIALLCLACGLVAPGARAQEELQEELTVGILVFDGFLTSEVTAPMEVFARAAAEGSIRFEPHLIAAEKKTVVSEEGVTILPDLDFARAPRLDVLVVPSAFAMEKHLADERLVGFIREKAAQAEYVASNCAGAFLLGKAGLLDGRQVTTYIGGAEELQKMFPKARVVDDRHVVNDGNLVSSIGGAASYEATLTLLEKIGGSDLADTVAEAIYYFPWLEREQAAKDGESATP